VQLALVHDLGRLLRVDEQLPAAIIDVSGDGTNNSGRDVRKARDEALGNEVTTINGLVILSLVPNSPNPSTPIRPAAWTVTIARMWWEDRMPS
jgi:Protein of unknown function (DUF1194)